VGCSTAPGIAGVYECDNMLSNDKKMPSTKQEYMDVLRTTIIIVIVIIKIY